MTPVTTTIPVAIKEEARKRGISIQSLVIRGWQSVDSFPAALERIRELEKNNEKLALRLQSTNEELWRIKEKSFAAK